MPIYHQLLTTTHDGVVCAEAVWLQTSTDKAALVADNRNRYWTALKLYHETSGPYDDGAEPFYRDGSVTTYSGGGHYSHRYYVEEKQ